MMHNVALNHTGPNEILFSGQPHVRQRTIYISCGCTLAPLDWCDWTVRVRRRCGLMSNYFDHLLLLFPKVCTFEAAQDLCRYSEPLLLTTYTVSQKRIPDNLTVCVTDGWMPCITLPWPCLETRPYSRDCFANEGCVITSVCETTYSV